MARTILITGGAGFIGSHLAAELARHGHKIRVLDNFSPQVHGSEAAIPEPIRGKIASVEIMQGDVRSKEDLRRALRGVDAVYHFAASVGVGQSMYEVHSYVDNNNMGTAALLQLLIENPVRKLIVASSMSIYGEGLYSTEGGTIRHEVRRDLEQLKKHVWEPVDAEGTSMEPVATPESKRPDLSSIYALSKYDQERMCLLVGRAYGIPTVALRFFNVYGRGQALSNPYTGVMAIFASRLLGGNPPVIFEDGNQRRDFVHVSDVVQACVLALEKPASDGLAINIGSGSNVSVREVADKMATSMGLRIAPEITQKYRVGDIRHCFADISLARRVLGYAPRVTLDAGIRNLVGWLSGRKAEDRSREAREMLDSRGLSI